jgi:FixJ family two-component response regulator
MTGRIVVAEDDAELAYALGRLLTRAGYNVAVFTNANDAWDDLKTGRRPRLLITDVSFPAGQTNGAALAAHASRCHPHLPIIFVTGYADLARFVDQQSGAPVFAKPVHEDVLMKRVRELAPLEC